MRALKHRAVRAITEQALDFAIRGPDQLSSRAAVLQTEGRVQSPHPAPFPLRLPFAKSRCGSTSTKAPIL